MEMLLSREPWVQNSDSMAKKGNWNLKNGSDRFKERFLEKYIIHKLNFVKPCKLM